MRFIKEQLELDDGLAILPALAAAHRALHGSDQLPPTTAPAKQLEDVEASIKELLGGD